MGTSVGGRSANHPAPAEGRAGQAAIPPVPARSGGGGGRCGKVGANLALFTGCFAAGFAQVSPPHAGGGVTRGGACAHPPVPARGWLRMPSGPLRLLAPSLRVARQSPRSSGGAGTTHPVPAWKHGRVTALPSSLGPGCPVFFWVLSRSSRNRAYSRVAVASMASPSWARPARRASPPDSPPRLPGAWLLQHRAPSRRRGSFASPLCEGSGLRRRRAQGGSGRRCVFASLPSGTVGALSKLGSLAHPARGSCMYVHLPPVARDGGGESVGDLLATHLVCRLGFTD